MTLTSVCRAVTGTTTGAGGTSPLPTVSSVSIWWSREPIIAFASPSDAYSSDADSSLQSHGAYFYRRVQKEMVAKQIIFNNVTGEGGVIQFL